MASRNRGLRSGYTTGACAAAAAKAATLLLVGGSQGLSGEVDIPFPDGTRHSFKVNRVWAEKNGEAVCASVVKDAGDDPDVTNGVEIVARVAFSGHEGIGQASLRGGTITPVVIKGGPGVGVVTRPGLPVPIGSPAINPVPARMIRAAVGEALREQEAANRHDEEAIEVTLSVPEGEKIAQKTLNGRLGIEGGISILGTTGIVRPISSEAWTATITASMNVARAMGRKEIVLSSGRTSERAHMKRYGLPEETYVMMGDYVQFALTDAAVHGFERIHLVAQWAKMLKVAMAIPQTHVRHGAIDPLAAASFLTSLGFPGRGNETFNTAREILDAVRRSPEDASNRVLSNVCGAARKYAESITTGVPVSAYLVSYEGEVIAQNG